MAVGSTIPSRKTPPALPSPLVVLPCWSLSLADLSSSPPQAAKRRAGTTSRAAQLVLLGVRRTKAPSVIVDVSLLGHGPAGKDPREQQSYPIPGQSVQPEAPWPAETTHVSHFCEDRAGS